MVTELEYLMKNFDLVAFGVGYSEDWTITGAIRTMDITKT